MHTLGYSFKPWRDAKAIADGSSILRYVKETAAEYGVDRHIRYGHRAVRAAWSSEDSAWTVEVERVETGETVRLTAELRPDVLGLLQLPGRHTPRVRGSERFAGAIVHPQQWPEQLDYRGKKVVVIGSGAPR
jgi:cation diffusion facilitator CzcD-associated flavoprotein CzcO